MNLLTKLKSFFSGNTEALEKRIAEIEEKNRGEKVQIVCVAESPIPQNKIIYNVSTGGVTVITPEGDTFNNNCCTEVGDIEKLKVATKEQIIRLLAPKKPDVEKFEEEIDTIITNYHSILEECEDFEKIGNEIFFKGIRSVAIPTIICGEFIRLLESVSFERNGGNEEEVEKLEEEYSALKNFTLKLLCNPIEESRNTLLDFVKNNNVAITGSGNLVLYRRVWKSKGNDTLLKFVTSKYLQVKQWKKNPANFEVYFENGEFKATDRGYKYEEGYEGNLKDLYNSLGKNEKITYTDDYTRSYVIQIPGVYKIKEEDIQLNRNGSCGGLLHAVGDVSRFNYSGYGDTDVLCLVNPMNIARTDTGYSAKIGVSEMYIASILNGIDWNHDINLVNLDEEYESICLQELETALRMKDLNKFSVSTEVTKLNYQELQMITNSLRERMVNIS